MADILIQATGGRRSIIAEIAIERIEATLAKHKGTQG